MSTAPTFDEKFIDEIKIPRESPRSKYVFQVYVDHDANITFQELAEKTGYSEKTVRTYYKKYNYRERADIYLSYKIKARAEYGIHQGNSFDASNFEMSNVELGLERKMLQHILTNFEEFLKTVPPQDIWKYFKDLHYLQRINLENGHTAKQSLIDSLHYIAEQSESGSITDKEAQDMMRELFDEWFKKPAENAKKLENEINTEKED